MSEKNPWAYSDAETFRKGVSNIESVRDHIQHRDAKRQALNDHVHRTAIPAIADRPSPSQAFNEGAHTGREAHPSRQVTDFDRSRKE